jgi:DNA-binding LacI/PurR family transcriptional regulator
LLHAVETNNKRNMTDKTRSKIMKEIHLILLHSKKGQFTFSEIARQTGVSKGLVKRVYNKGRVLIRKYRKSGN